jgi:predicted aspartyl protease
MTLWSTERYTQIVKKETLMPRKTVNIVQTIWKTSALLACAIGCYPGVAAVNMVDSRNQTITVEEGIVLVDVMMNGRGWFRMIVDTGAASCILNPAAARNAGVSLRPPHDSSDAQWRKGGARSFEQPHSSGRSK